MLFGRLGITGHRYSNRCVAARGNLSSLTSYAPHAQFSLTIMMMTWETRRSSETDTGASWPRPRISILLSKPEEILKWLCSPTIHSASTHKHSLKLPNSTHSGQILTLATSQHLHGSTTNVTKMVRILSLGLLGLFAVSNALPVQQEEADVFEKVDCLNSQHLEDFADIKIAPA